MSYKLYKNRNTPQYFKDMLVSLFTDIIGEVKEHEHNSSFDYISNDGDMYFGECPMCGGDSGYKHLGTDVWMYCEKHKTKWITSCGDLVERGDETDDEVTNFFNDGDYEVVEPIFSRLELPENKAAMLEDLKDVPVTPVYEIRLTGDGIQECSRYSLHPLPESCELQVRFKNNLKPVEKLMLLSKVFEDLKRQVEYVPIEFGGNSVRPWQTKSSTHISLATEFSPLGQSRVEYTID